MSTPHPPAPTPGEGGDPFDHPDFDAHASDQAPRPEHHHRAVTGGTHRAAVFGVSDGLVSNVSLILGVAGANASAEVVRVAGIAGLIAGAVSMAAGEYVSMQAQRELLERELEKERLEILRVPEIETVELAQIYEARGISRDTARQLAREVHQDPDLALQVHAREELGVDPDELGDPVGAAVSSFVAFALGAMVPLIPWLFTEGMAATVVAIVLAGVAALAVGGLLGRLTDRSVTHSALRQFGIAAFAAAVTYGVGTLFGVSTA